MKPMYIIIGVVVAAIVLFAAFKKAQNPEGVTQLKAEEFKQHLETNKDVQVLDVRTADERNGGYIENSISIDFYANNFNEMVLKLDKEKPVYVYCASGIRSLKACKTLHKNGYETYNLKGGFNSWKGQGYPSAN